MTEQELQPLAQNVCDLQSLEQALKRFQQAKKANDGEQLDGEEFSGCKGIGSGGSVEVDKNARTDFKSEQARFCSDGNRAAFPTRAKHPRIFRSCSAM